MRNLEHYQPICSAICLLLPSLTEVVLHDLTSGKIAHIENNSSNRNVGDESLLETEDYQSELQADGTIGPYTKYRADGEKLKSISAVLRNSDGDDIGLLCINMRVDALESAQATLALLAGITHESAAPSLIKNDWREVANTVIAEQLQTLQTSIVAAKRSHRQSIVAALQRSAVFEARGSIEYVATALGISRASLYNLLKVL